MRRVPFENSYLLVGGGRLALHLSTYFDLQKIQYKSWNRTLNSFEELRDWAHQSQYILLAISDDQIESFYKSHALDISRCLHFSGALEIEGMKSFHPLMSFSKKPEGLLFYQTIPFVGSLETSHFRDIFPELTNPYFQIPQNKKSLYHALCVLSGNGTQQLWDSVEEVFSEIGLPREVLAPYLFKICQNIVEDSSGRFTGPWYRGDQNTISKNRDALRSTHLLDSYDSIMKLSLNQQEVPNEVRA